MAIVGLQASPSSSRVISKRWTCKGGMGGTAVVNPAPTQEVSVGPDAHMQATVFAVASRARVHVEAPRLEIPARPHRLSEHVDVTMPAPIVVEGRPVMPRWRATVDCAGTTQMGVGHIRSFNDPDPVWNGVGWDIPPPPMPAGAQFLRWTTKQLPDPANYNYQGRPEYPLGTRSANDSTDLLPAGAAGWATTPGSDANITWQSRYPFKPYVRAHVHYGPDNSRKTEAAGLYFDPISVQHMWADFGTLLDTPFTVLIVGVITRSRPRFYNWVLDAGQDQTDLFTEAQRQHIRANGWAGTKRVGEALGYRLALRIGHHRQSSFVDPGAAKLARVPYVHTYKPKMWFMVVNGASSLVGNYATGGRHIHAASFGHYGPWRDLVLGRRNGILDKDTAASMVLFEMRVITGAMSTDQLQASYDQLSTTWRFHDYH